MLGIYSRTSEPFHFSCLKAPKNVAFLRNTHLVMLYEFGVRRVHVVYTKDSFNFSKGITLKNLIGNHVKELLHAPTQKQHV